MSALKSVSDLERFFGGRDRPTTETLLRELITEIQGLRADFRSNVADRRHFSPSHLTREDRTRLAKILPPTGGLFGSEPFSSRDLAEDESPAVRLVLCGLSVKGISKLFGRAAGIPIDGLMVRKAGMQFGVTMWHVVAC